MVCVDFFKLCAPNSFAFLWGKEKKKREKKMRSELFLVSWWCMQCASVALSDTGTPFCSVPALLGKP